MREEEGGREGRKGPNDGGRESDREGRRGRKGGRKGGKEGGRKNGRNNGRMEGRRDKKSGAPWETGVLKVLVGSGELWKNSEKGRKGGRRRGDSISGPVDVRGLGAVRLDLMEQEGREKGDGVGR